MNTDRNIRAWIGPEQSSTAGNSEEGSELPILLKKSSEILDSARKICFKTGLCAITFRFR